MQFYAPRFAMQRKSAMYPVTRSAGWCGSGAFYMAIVYTVDEVMQPPTQPAHDHLCQLSLPASRGQFASTNASWEIKHPQKMLKILGPYFLEVS